MTVSLHSQQQDFFGQVVASEPDAHAAERILRRTRATPAQQFEVYRHAYVARLVDCLRDDYPLVELALGTEPFERVCRQYAQACPPQTNSLNFYGRRFAAYLKASVSDALAWTCDLARVEWALIEAIHADASQVLSPAAFAHVGQEDWSSLQLQTSDTLQLLTLEHDIAEHLSKVSRGDELVAPEQRQSVLAICRSGNDLWRLPLEPWAASLLRQLWRGRTLGEALDGLSTDANPAPTEEQVFHTFARWLEAGVFRGITLH